MTAKELLLPRFEVIALYPECHLEIGQIIENFTLNSPEYYELYPNIFRKLNWWEYRKVEEMPVKLISKTGISSLDTILEIEEWDMTYLWAWIDKSKREGVNLLNFKPEYGYFPID